MRLLIFVVGFVITYGAQGATIHLKSEATPRGAIVYLGDVADIAADSAREAERMESIELMPSPAGNAVRYLQATQVQELLDARGFDLRTIRLGGASQVKLVSPASGARDAPQASSYEQRRAERMANDAIRRHLTQSAAASQAWQIDVQLSPADAARIVRTAGSLTASGGARPYTGGQSFQLHWQGSEREESLDVLADVSLPASVVTATRPIPRGTLIRADDLVLQPAPQTRTEQVLQAAYLNIEDAVGKEAVRNIAAGQPLDAQNARSPILVKQNDVVTVYSRAGGVSVRTHGRARQSGSQGELITIETFDRKPFFARVSGHQEVEVLATATTLAPSAPR
ncbi:MAG: flagellar basal body P-ring formation protein FlgA [Planctomycetales bacterium]|nr:flagellar basal body P-ring formation protein FlgA [Planctomycetales bacterium]